MTNTTTENSGPLGVKNDYLYHSTHTVTKRKRDRKKEGIEEKRRRLGLRVFKLA